MFKGAIRGMDEGADDILYIANYGLINIKTCYQKHYIHKPHDNSSLIYNDVAGISKDKNGNIWISTPGGVGRINKRNNTFKNYHTNDSIPNSLSHDRVLHMFNDSKGRMWFCTNNGLNMYDFENDNFRLVKFNHNTNSSEVLSNGILDVNESTNGDLWVSTRNGIFVLGAYDLTLKGLVKDSVDILKEVVYKVLEADSAFWGSTNNGLLEIDKETYIVKARYFDEDGLLSNEFNSGAAIKIKNGDLLFGGVKGATLFDPNKIHLSTF